MIDFVSDGQFFFAIRPLSCCVLSNADNIHATRLQHPSSCSSRPSLWSGSRCDPIHPLQVFYNNQHPAAGLIATYSHQTLPFHASPKNHRQCKSTDANSDSSTVVATATAKSTPQPQAEAEVEEAGAGAEAKQQANRDINTRARACTRIALQPKYAESCACLVRNRPSTPAGSTGPGALSCDMDNRHIPHRKDQGEALFRQCPTGDASRSGDAAAGAGRKHGEGPAVDGSPLAVGFNMFMNQTR